MSLILVLVVAMSLVACSGKDAGKSGEADENIMEESISNDTVDETEEEPADVEEKSESGKLGAEYDKDDLESMIAALETDFESAVELVESESERFLEEMGNTYEGYDENREKLTEFYADSKALSDEFNAMYDEYSDSWETMYDAHSDAWSKIYDDYSAVWGGFYSGDDDVEALLEKAAEERAKSKEDKEQTKDKDAVEQSSDEDSEGNGEGEDGDSQDAGAEGIRPEFKEAMDSYEAFYDEYCDFFEKYNENPTDVKLIAEYADIMQKAADMDDKFNEWNGEDLSPEELEYYVEVSSRVTQKMLDVAY